MASSSSSCSQMCFNPECKVTKSERWRKGWRLRTGEYAELCDRCGSAYDDVNFCENFHSNVPGWRNCESCSKQVHCGCIASIHTFMLLDAGGIECMACAKKNSIMASNQKWPSSLLLPVPLPERLKDLGVKSWSQITGSTPVPGPWRPATNLWNSSTGQSELHPRVPYEFDKPISIDRLISCERPSASSQERKISEDPTPGSLKLATLDRLGNGNIGIDASPSLSAFHREEGNGDAMQHSGNHTSENGSADIRKVVVSEPGLKNSAPGINFETNSSTASLLFGSAASFTSPNETNDPLRVSGALAKQQMPPPALAKHFYANPNNGIDSSGEFQTQIRNGRPRGEARGRNQLLPRYWPRFTDQELQQISGDSNSVITPLFEKMLSASDAGRIGRLVLPKKCAEAYFPTISQPEGLPLKVQDARGKEWVFQFRFWPNNNSRMYVLEGVTPCIQSMQLQAGDTVTFSRIDPEGKLVMGFRKASSIPSEQDIQAPKTGNGFATSGEVNNRNSKPSEIASTPPLRPYKGGTESTSHSSKNQINPTDPTHTLSKFDKAGCMLKEGAGLKSTLPTKRKSSTLGSKSKRLRIDNEDSIELKLTWEEAQWLLRPPPNHVPTIVVIEGHEFEEYEEAPVLGKPTIFMTDNAGERSQWARCEDCSKWRKLPVDALLPPRWTCSDNLGDPKRSSCSSAQEITTQQLENLLCPNAATSKRIKAKQDKDTVDPSAGLDTLANLAILGEGETLLPSSTQTTTKHPRHRPGCTCIVCIQPPSGKGPKHKQTCMCNVCLTVRRRFRTLMLRREKRQSEREAESALKKKLSESPEKLLDQEEEEEEELANINSSDILSQKIVATKEVFDDDFVRKKSLSSPFKGSIDLNIQPEREEEPSPPVADPSSILLMKIRDATEQYLKQQSFANSAELVVNQVGSGGNVGEENRNGGPHDSSSLDADMSHPVTTVSLSMSASTSATG
ncbi:B3 domain-containing protein Os07g0563300-like [Tasmannia lanceolata]|uniref:B3 domain-containing protein Os07g0563300-like n=1 Tax=Tasmannia lanceolata TaxID=3420 RepID=UPI0040648740